MIIILILLLLNSRLINIISIGILYDILPDFRIHVLYVLVEKVTVKNLIFIVGTLNYTYC